MRNPNRIPEFTANLGELIVEYFPDNSIPQIVNMLIHDELFINPKMFYMEEKDFLEAFKEFGEKKQGTLKEDKVFDSSRVANLMYELGESWKKGVPDWRFGQVLYNFWYRCGGNLADETEFFSELKRYLER